MTTWNVHLKQRPLLIKVKRVLQKEPEFMVILDNQERKHKLSEIDFPSFEWEKIGPGAMITLIITESVINHRFQPPKVEKSIRKIVDETRQKVAGCFFIWVCPYCGTKGYVDYEDGDDTQRIMERIVMSHKEAMKAGCKCAIRIFDHRGYEQENSSLFLSSKA
ncbi:MAG: hypothetical protein ABH841_02840 [Candidatus Nealsonbacteria bacterium]